MDHPFKHDATFNIVLSPPVFKLQLLEKIAAG